jgi:signal transduction histidine kinase/CheY-like chemotaxis protein
MAESIFTIALRSERDVVEARQRARELAAAVGFDNQDQIRLATATSEVARNAFRYATNAVVAFNVVLDIPQRLEVEITDSGPGIPHLEEILEGRYKSASGMGMGILGTRRLMDEFSISAGSKGTTVRMGKRLPRHGSRLSSQSVREVTQKLLARPPGSPYEEIERQNKELLKTLQELRNRQEQLGLLNRELEDTNRGVVALYAELDERADYLRRASELKTKFLSNVSHEFRTPLNSVISLSRMLMDKMDGDLTPEQEKQVRYIESSARDLQDMVNDLLDLAKVEAGKIKMRPKTFQVKDLFSGLKGMLKPLLADNHSVDIIFEDPADVAPLHTDEGKVSQILRNLISNALKFTPTGTVTVTARRIEEHRVLFAVADTGIGIPPEHHETIFKEFGQVDNPLQDRHRGTGLGLPLCRNLAMLLGGRLWLKSEAGKGSTFFAEIPMIYTGESLVREDATFVPATEFHRDPVLIVEGNPQDASLFESLLRHSEFQPIVVRDIDQAEVWMARHAPVAVLSEVQVGADSTWGFILNVRDRFPNLPVLLTSTLDEKHQALAKGASDFLLKPVERNALLSVLRTLTSHTGIRRLLIVDDNEVSRYIVRELLDRPWLDISEASSGSEAVRMLGDDPPDALILDLLMPDMSGFEVLRRLRGQPSTEFLPVLVYTSKSLSEAESLELQALGTRVVRKDDVSTRLSPQAFLDWLENAGLSPQSRASEQNA